MQMYPRDGGYKEQYYAEEYIVEEDVKGPTMHMMMKPHGYGGHTDLSKHNQHGYGSQFKDKYGQQQAHHGYGGHNDGHHGYGGYDDHHKNGVESYSTQYVESRYEKERRDGPWSEGNDYSGHGGKHQNGHGYGHNDAMKHNGYGAHDGHKIAAMKHGGYGAHEGHYGPHQEIRAPVWKFKGIDD